MPRPPRSAPSGRLVLIAAFDGVQSLDVVGPFEVFQGANALMAAEDPTRPLPYDVRVVDLAPPTAGRPTPTVRTESGLPIGVQAFDDPAAVVDTLILPGGLGVHEARKRGELIVAIRTIDSRSRRLATVCTGTFLAAEAGLLDGHTVTTHWARAARLASEYPLLTVDPEPIYRREGRVWTSAGVTAGIDLSLALVEEDLGGELAQTVARWLVMFLHRPGGQSQFATPVWAPRARHRAVRVVQELIERDPTADHRLETLARHASMSPRHLTRVFTEEVGETPCRYVELVRVASARTVLERTDDTLEVVASRCGFGTAETLRRSFQRHLAVAPDQYRQRFRTRGHST